MIHLNDKTYQIVYEYKEAWNPEAFRDRYSEVLDRYDYIVGDWGYNQLRLKGFFKENSSKASKDTTIAGLQDYLNEYCNFGCAYFVIERMPNPNRIGENMAESPELEADQEEAYEREERKERVEQGDRREPRVHRHRYEQGNRFEPGQRNDNANRTEPQSGQEHGLRSEQGNKNDHNNRNDRVTQNQQGSRGDNRDRGRNRDRRFRGGRPDKPAENKQSGSAKDKTPIV